MIFMTISGTNVSYAWSCTGDTTASVATSFSSAGYKWCRATVSNQVSHKRKNKRIAVQDLINSVAIRWGFFDNLLL